MVISKERLPCLLCEACRAAQANGDLEPSSQLAVNEKSHLDHSVEGPHGRLEVHAAMKCLAEVDRLEVLEYPILELGFGHPIL